MKLLVNTDAHLFRTPDDKIWCEAIYQYSFWQRYLTTFDKVRVVGRLKDTSNTNKNWLRVDGENVEIWGIPHFQGLKQLAKKYLKIKKALKGVYDGCDAALYRMPSPSGQIIYGFKRCNIPFAVEVVYDPIDLLNFNDGIVHYFSSLKFAHDLKVICKKANGVSYVTKESIQKNFPSCSIIHGESAKDLSSYYSTITLNEAAYGKPRKYLDKKQFVIAHSNVKMNSNRKGEIILLEALKYVREVGYDVKVMFIGDGDLRSDFEEKAQKLDISEYVNFVGLMPTPEAVREKLLIADMYVFPTLAEGLPRGIIEAMAVGLPCISSPVGGIPELIDKEYLVPPTDSRGYAEAIIKLISNPEGMEKLSAENIEKALEYKNEILQKRREDFYRKLYNLARLNK